VKVVQIDRKRNLTPDNFMRDHLQGVGKPVIITDAIQGWRARSKWTFDYLKKSYGWDLVRAKPAFMSDVVKLTKLSAYIDHLDTPTKEVPGFWIKNGKQSQPPPQPYEQPLYVLGWFPFQAHPELYDDIQPAPYFVHDWLWSLTPTLRDLLEWTCDRPYLAVSIGPKGSRSPLHYDFAHTHGYLAQIQGRKRAILFSPSDSQYLYNGRVDPEQPDPERFPLYDQATAYECVIEPGELLFMPPRWWHFVLGLEKSITVGHNFFNDVNFSQHLTSLLRRLPRLVQAFEQVPQWRDELDVQWRSKDLANPLR
jgi:hypothetical protein